MLNFFSFKKDKFKQIAPFIVLIFLAIVLFFVFSGSSSAFKEQDEIVTKTLQNAFELKSFVYDGKIETRLTEVKGSSYEDMREEGATFGATFSGYFDFKDKENIKTSNFVDVDPGPSVDGKINAEVKSFGSMFYFKINTLPDFGVPLDLDKFMGIWIGTDLDDYKDSAEEAPSPEFTQEELAQIKEIISSSGVVRVTDGLQEENIANSSQYHFKIEINKRAVRKLSSNLDVLRDGGSYGVGDFRKIYQTIGSFNNPKGDIWIDKETMLPQELSLVFEVEDEQNTKNKGELTLDIRFRDFNTILEVEEPAPYTELNSVLTELGIPVF